MRLIGRTLGPLFRSKVTGYIRSFLSRMEWRCILFPDSTFHVRALFILRHNCPLQKFQTTAATEPTMKKTPSHLLKCAQTVTPGTSDSSSLI
jgi:hypothetical protein